MKAIATIIRYIWTKNDSLTKFLLIASLVALVVSKGFTVLVPVILKYVVDDLSGGIEVIPMVMLGFYGFSRAASQMFGEVKEICFVYVSQGGVKKFAADVFHVLNNLSLRFHLDRKTGGMNLSVNRGIKALENILTFMTFIVVPVIFEFTITCGVILWLYPLTYWIITVITLGIYVFYTIYVTQKRTRYIRTMKKAENDFNTKAVDVLLNYETVKYFCKECYEEESYRDLLERYSELVIKNKFFLSLLNAGQVLIIAAGLTVMMGFAADEVVQGTMTVGGFLLVNLYLMQLYTPLGNLGFAYREIMLSSMDLRDMNEQIRESSSFALAQEVVDGEQSLGASSVEFDSVCFAYDQNRQIIRGISFKLQEGDMLAVVGSSGAGKSTIARLLYRFYEAQSGDILIGGRNIREINTRSLRSKIGIVPQDTVLFNESIYYNIAYGYPDGNPTVEAVEEAARMANLHDFIASLPDGYNTVVGERGLKLSGGEKQRIAIARVLIKEPDIFVFDEATSALDTATEKVIQVSIGKLAKLKTSIVIAHRLSTVVDADTIIVLDDGIIAESGNHKQLLARKGLYSRLWMEQQRG